jgi:hypothetical protein
MHVELWRRHFFSVVLYCIDIVLDEFGTAEIMLELLGSGLRRPVLKIFVELMIVGTGERVVPGSAVVQTLITV